MSNGHQWYYAMFCGSRVLVSAKGYSQLRRFLQNVFKYTLISRHSGRARYVCLLFYPSVFRSSPDQGPGAIWNYTLYQDPCFEWPFNIRSNRNNVQIYTLPTQHAIDSLLANSHGGPGLPPPENIRQHAFAYKPHYLSVSKEDAWQYQGLVRDGLGFAFFIAMCGVSYHLTGHITQQREIGMLELIDASKQKPP